MKLSTKSEYALLALIDIASHLDQKWVKISDISERNNIPQKYLEQILLFLKRGGYLRSRRGAEGGYTLAREASTISLAEIIRLMDGALAPVDSVSKYFYGETPISRNEKLLNVFRGIRDYISDTLENLKLSDLIE